MSMEVKRSFANSEMTDDMIGQPAYIIRIEDDQATTIDVDEG